jgi:magnesium transporter
MAHEGKQAIILDSLRKFMRRGAKARLINLAHKVRPPDFAGLYPQLTELEQIAFFRHLVERDAQYAGELLSHLNPVQGADLLIPLGSELGGRLLDHCPEDDAAKIMAEMPEEARNTLLASMKHEEAAEVEKLLIYDEETAGRIMTPEVFALNEHVTVGEAVTALQEAGDVELAFYIYVVDDRNHLIGVFSLRQLLLHRPDSVLRELMNTDLISVRTDTDQEEVARLAQKYDLIAVPVLDDQGRLVGVITIDDLVDVLRDEATEDFYRLAGTSQEERRRPSVWTSVRIRTPWLLASFVGGYLASLVVGSYRETLAALPLLAGFIPVILGMGGNVGTQSATIIVRGLATGRVDSGNLRLVAIRELVTALLLGGIYGVLLGLAAYFLTSLGWETALVLGVALLASILIAATIGACVPVVLHRIGVDPAVATGPFVTTSVDILGVLVLFAFATMALLWTGS